MKHVKRGILFRAQKRVSARGQISLFVILGLFIVIALGVMYSISQTGVVESEVVVSVANVNHFVTSCLEQQGRLGVALAGAQGGYVYDSAFPGWIDQSGLHVHFGHYVGYNLVPTRDEVAVYQLKRFVDETLSSCIDGFRSLGPGVQATGSASSTVRILDSNIEFVLDYPVVILEGKKQTLLDRFTATINVPLGKMLDDASLVASGIVENPNAIDLTLIDSLPYRVDVIKAAPQEMVYSFNLEGYTLQFGSLEFVDNAPNIFDLGVLTGTVGEEFSIRMSAVEYDGEAMTFSSDVFDIDPVTGVVSFVPLLPGTYTSVITVTDESGLTDSTELVVVV